MSKLFWVTWEEQRRNKQIADAIDAEFHEIVIKGSKIKRYLKCLWQTFKLYKQQPDIVICQNPSIVLALFTVCSKKIFGFKAGIDTHNGRLGFDNDALILRLVANFLQKYADFTIITNEPLKTFVEENGGKAVVLPDKIPNIPKIEPVKLKHKYNILFICSYAEDEPYTAVFEAANHVKDKDVGIYVTGKYENKIDINKFASPNLHFMGRVPWETFDTMLYSVDAVIDLTTREYCLVCGAYEAAAVEKPLILSNTIALSSYFNKGAVYTGNNTWDIIHAIEQFVENQDKLNLEVKQLKVELQHDWELRKQELLKIIENCRIIENETSIKLPA